MKNLLFFSHNNKKILEVESIFDHKGIKIQNLRSFGKIKEPNENGLSFGKCRDLNRREDGDNLYERRGLIYWDQNC